MPVASEKFLRYERHCLRWGSSDRLKRVGKRPLIRYALREERKCGFDSHSADHIRPPRFCAAGDLIFINGKNRCTNAAVFDFSELT